MFKNIAMLLKARSALKAVLATKSSEAASTWAGLAITALNLLAPGVVAYVNPLIEKVTGQSLTEVAGIMFTYAAMRLFKTGDGAAWVKPTEPPPISASATLYPPKP